jgi:hypothetical protein
MDKLYMERIPLSFRMKDILDADAHIKHIDFVKSTNKYSNTQETVQGRARATCYLRCDQDLIGKSSKSRISAWMIKAYCRWSQAKIF